MEDNKRKFHIQPVQQQSTSNFGRKISKYVFKIGQTNKSEAGKVVSKLRSDNKYIVNICDIKQEERDNPSIVLCQSDSVLNNPVLEQQLHITSGSVTKKQKIITQNPSKIKTSIRPLIKPKKYIQIETNTIIDPKEVIKKDVAGGHAVSNTVDKIQPLLRTDETKGKEKKKGLSSIEEKEEKLIKKKIIAEEKRLRTEHERLTKLLDDLKTKSLKVLEVQSYQKERLTLNKLKENYEMLYYYIGFKDFELLESMVFKLQDYFSIREKVTEELLFEDQLIMVLMKLRRNYSMHDLAHRFRVSTSEAECIVFNVILALHHIYYKQDLKQKPFSSQSSDIKNIPDQFKSFPNCRVVLECVKIRCEDPNNISVSDVLTSSKFDPKIKLKGLLGISSSKLVLFASNLYDESTSNTDVFKDCEIVEKLQEGDLIMADKSFEIGDLLPPTIELNVPSSCKSSMTEKQIRNLNSKARAFIGRTTMQHIRRFCILNHIPIFLNSMSSEVFQLCSALVNFQPTITTNRQEELD